MLQFFDDLPGDRWAAFLYVERHARQAHLNGPPSTQARRKYVQMVLVAAYELELHILPLWQTEGMLLYRVIGFSFDVDDNDGGGFEAFERDLAAAIPKIESLAAQGTALRGREQRPLKLHE